MNRFLCPTPFIGEASLGSVTPSWREQILANENPQRAAEEFYQSTLGYFEGPSHNINGVTMREVSFLDWQLENTAKEHFLLIAGQQASRIHDLNAIKLRPAGKTPLLELTLLLPTDCCYSYSFSTPIEPMPDTKIRHDCLVWLYKHHRACRLNPDVFPEQQLSIYQGRDFDTHHAVRAMQPNDPSLTKMSVKHDDGREREVWSLRAKSGTSRTVILFDGDAWFSFGIGSRAWENAGYDANLVLMSSMEYSDRRTDLTVPSIASSTVSDVLRHLADAWQIPTPTGSEVILVGQSWGGLGVVGVLLTDPAIANRGVCISGSFFFDPHKPDPQEDFTSIGLHRSLLATTNPIPNVRLAMISGRDEPIAQQSLDFLKEAKDRGLDIVSFTHVRGAHEYCWWRHAIFHGLDVFLSPVEDESEASHAAKKHSSDPL